MSDWELKRSVDRTRMDVRFVGIFIGFMLLLIQIGGCVTAIQLNEIIKRLPEPPAEKAK